MTDVIKDAQRTHWVYRLPQPARAFAQLSRLDRPVGYWLLCLPGWIGLAFATLSHGFAMSDLKWAMLILIGSIAMRGAGCTYNDIVDQDLDAQVERSALRPLPAGTITTKQAWIWLFAQCFVGLIVLLCLPRLGQIISLCSIPLVAAYPFMKRITWWPQFWLGLTFNWAVLVAYGAKTGTVSVPLFILYTGLIFWTVGYDTIYACQDIEDDMKIGVKSTARRFGKRVKLGVGLSYVTCISLIIVSKYSQPITFFADPVINVEKMAVPMVKSALWTVTPFALHLFFQVIRFQPTNSLLSLNLFKANIWAGTLLMIMWLMSAFYWNYAAGI